MAMQTMGLGFRVPDDSTNRLEWLPNGRVRLFLGAPDLGQGLATVAAQMTAEALGIPYEQIDIMPLDTSLSPDGGVTCASRMTYSVGNSVCLAAENLISDLIQQTARQLQIPVEQIKYSLGQLIRLDRPQSPPIPAIEIISRMAEEELTLDAQATFSFPYGPETPDHLPFGMPHTLFCFGAQVARVEIDPQLGKVEVTEVSAIHDVGKTIHRQAVEGQIEGGVVTGLGYALSEDVKQKANGRWVDNFTEYLFSTALDIPEIKVILLEYPEATAPFGAKGIGEISLVPTAAAICNAVNNATGKRVHRIPITPETLL